MGRDGYLDRPQTIAPRVTNVGGPASDATRERAFSLANEAMYTVAPQVGRLGSSEPEDQVFIFRWCADLQFLIVALRRLRRAASLALQVPSVASEIKAIEVHRLSTAWTNSATWNTTNGSRGPWLDQGLTGISLSPPPGR